MNQGPSLQMIGDTFQHFDEVDGRIRPMRVDVNYVGHMPDGGIAPGENLYRVTGSELLKRHVYTLDGMSAPFDLEDVRTHTELRSELEARKISTHIVQAIRQLIARDSYAPKCGSVCDGQILIAVSYDDLPQSSPASIRPEPDVVVDIPECVAWRVA